MQTTRSFGRFTAWILAVLVVLLMLVSYSFIAKEANHDCTGEDCPVCAFIQQCESTMHRIGSGLIIPAVCLIPVILCFFSILTTVTVILQETPVLNKVRLNN